MKYLFVLFLAACSSQTRAPSSKYDYKVGASEGGAEIVAALKQAKPPLKLADGTFVTGAVDCHSGFDMSPTACDLFNSDGSPGSRVVKDAASSLWKRMNAVKLKAYPNGELDQEEIDSVSCTPDGDCTVRVSPSGGAI